MSNGGRDVTNYDAATAYGDAVVAHADDALLAQANKVTGKGAGSKRKRQTTGKPKKVDLASVVTRDAFIHIYEAPDVGKGGFSRENLFKYIVVGRSGNKNEVDDNEISDARQTGIVADRWHGITVHLEDNRDGAATDLQRSFSTEGAFVVYYGHSLLTTVKPKLKAAGLDPKFTQKRKDMISARTLTKMLDNSKAKIFLGGACGSKTCIRPPKSDIIVVAISSPKLTNTVVLANAVIDFIDVLVENNGTVNEAISAGNKIFAQYEKDEFVLVNGEGSIRLI